MKKNYTYQIDKLEPIQYHEALELIYQSFMKYDAPDYSEEGIEAFRKDVYTNPLFLKMLEQEGNGMYGAFQDEELVGVLGVRRRNHILLLYVREDKLKCGIGSVLVKHFLEQSNEELITVNSAPFAYGFYEKLGFKITGDENVKHGIRSTPMQIKC